MQAYSNPKRASDPYSLPDVEVFYMDSTEISDLDWKDEEGDQYEPGWYWWTCLPGCLPDSSPFGPFPSRAEALADAQDNEGFEDDDESGE